MTTQMTIMLVAAVIFGAIVFVLLDRMWAKLRPARRRPIPMAPEVEVLGEAEQIYNLFNDKAEMPFVYIRMALVAILAMPALMVFLNIKGYAEWNWLACIFIILIAIKIIRWQTVLGIMLTGSVEDWLASTKEKPEDLTEGALEGLYFFLKAVGYTIVGVWILSIILALVPFGHAPKAFPLLLLGGCGFFLYSALRGFKGVAWLRDGFVTAIFLGLFVLGTTIYFGLSWAEVKDLLATYNLSPSSIVIFSVIAVGIYLYNLDEKEGQ